MQVTKILSWWISFGDERLHVNFEIVFYLGPAPVVFFLSLFVPLFIFFPWLGDATDNYTKRGLTIFSVKRSNFSSIQSLWNCYMMRGIFQDKRALESYRIKSSKERVQWKENNSNISNTSKEEIIIIICE